MQAAIITKAVTPYMTVNLGGGDITVDNPPWSEATAEMNFTGQNKVHQLCVSALPPVVSPTPSDDSPLDSSLPSGLRQLLTERIEGKNISLNFSNIAVNQLYEVYLYTAKFSTTDKHAFDIKLQDITRDSIDAD